MVQFMQYKQDSWDSFKILNNASYSHVWRKDFWTAPFDPRFPNTNQTKNCWQNYIDYHRCQKVKGEDYGPCEYYKRVYNSICPNAWTEKWDEQRAEGRFPGRI